MSLVLYKGKWDGIWDRPKYQEMRKKIVESFKGLTFIEEGHKYFLNGKEMMCVSNVAHMFQEHTDWYKKAFETSANHFDDENSPYYRMTGEEIFKAWKDNSSRACTHGSERHEFGESCYWYMTGQFDKILPAFKDRLTEDGGFLAIHPKEEATVKFWEDLPVCFVPIAVENITYNKKLNYSGTFDMLFYYDAELDGKSADKSGFVIFDYKTNKDLYKNFQEKKLLPPFQELLDMPCNLYKLQLSLYQLNLEQLGFKVIGRRLIWLRPDGGYDKIPLESYTRVLSEELTKNPII